ncbi:MAG: twin-arginine translocase TatA/TatE family subunit [Bacteroidota bacterium]|nr:twin-arginine translocase TatA/TatE family subunit [Bacteroidota bacterium]
MLLFSGLVLGAIGAPEIIVILVIVLLFFGGKKIPELMRGLGQGMKEFKDASKGEDKKTSASTEVKPEDK